jgi:hypothetical protein
MKYLTQKDPSTGLTPVEVYIQKQAAWAKSQDDWDAANIQAKSKSISFAWPSILLLMRSRRC